MSIYCESVPSGKWRGLRMQIDGGERLELPDDHDLPPLPRRISPDGKLALSYQVEKQNSKRCVIKLVPDGNLITVLDIEGDDVRWSPDGRALTYIADRDSTSNVWNRPINMGGRTQLTNFTGAEGIFTYALS